MDALSAGSPAARNIRLYPWFKFFQSLLFWQAVWALFYQSELSAAHAVIIYVIYDLSTAAVEVPSGYFSDRIGRRFTLILSGVCMVAAAAMQGFGEGFLVFGLAQVFLGAGMAFNSGTDSAILYESLVEEGRGEEVEAQELRAWRFTFTAMALSAVTGGMMSLWWDRLPFIATAAAFLVALALTLRMAEPGHKEEDLPQGAEVLRFRALGRALVNPALAWVFAIAVLMYGFSHIPFVFGQPYILQALEGVDAGDWAPVVSGAVTTVMMLVSLAASVIAPGIRARIGLAGILLLAFGMQVGIAAVLAATPAALAIAVLFLRMVPDSLSRPFILARIQPLLEDRMRATYLSIKSLTGRILFSGSLILAAGSASDVGAMTHPELARILWAYVAVGCVAWGTLWLARSAAERVKP